MSMPSHEVVITKEGKEGKKIYVKIGVMFKNADGSFGIKLDALPLTGELYAPVIKEQGSRETKG